MGTEIVPDACQDDLSLVVQNEQGLAVLCGCCHAGLLNTLEHVQRVWQQTVACGTRLISAADAAFKTIAKAPNKSSSLKHIYLNHCSGENAAFLLSLMLGNVVVRSCPAGTVLE